MALITGDSFPVFLLRDFKISGRIPPDSKPHATTILMKPKLLLRFGPVRSKIGVSVPFIRGCFVVKRFGPSIFAAESKLVDISSPTNRARYHERHANYLLVPGAVIDRPGRFAQKTMVPEPAKSEWEKHLRAFISSDKFRHITTGNWP